MILHVLTGRRRGPALLAVHASSGVPFMAGLFSAAVALAVGVLFDASIGGLWADALNLPLTAAGYLVPIAAGSAATAAGALARTGVLALAATAPDGRRRAVLLSWCAVVLWQVVSLGVLLVIAPVRLSAAGSLSAPMVLLPASALVLLLAATAVGTVIGTRWPSPVVAPILALAVFVPLYAFIYADGRAAAFAVIFPGTFYQPWFEPHVELVTAQIGLVGSVLLGAGAALLRGRRGAVVGAGAAVCACVALTALLTIEPNPVQLRRSHESRAPPAKV